MEMETNWNRCFDLHPLAKEIHKLDPNDDGNALSNVMKIYYAQLESIQDIHRRRIDQCPEYPYSLWN